LSYGGGTVRGMMAQTQSVVYQRASVLRPEMLSLQTAGVHPQFFTGFLTAARVVAVGLTVLADVAGADFRLDQLNLRGMRDPVVTCGGGLLRFEALSACCGVYARLDVLPEALDGEMPTRGTTNVDINPPLYAALTRVATADPLRLSVGPDQLGVTTLDGQVVEKKVPLPERWLRGLAEAGFVSAGFDLRAELGGAQAAGLLHRLPAHRGREVRWFVPAGRGVRASSGPAPGAVCLAGARRLALVRPLLPMARTVRLYGPAVGRASAPVASGWELRLPGARFALLLSPGVDRGLSGEGGLLPHLAQPSRRQAPHPAEPSRHQAPHPAEPTGEETPHLAEAGLPAGRLGWDDTVEAALLAAAGGLGGEEVRGVLAAFAVSGKVGYDWAEGAYFHRELPYRPELPAALNPRLRAARALVAEGAVRAGPDGVSVGGHLVHAVAAGGLGCTCRWWVEHRGGRGPCKHVLAATLAREAQ
jgi:SWIM zinc finger